MTYRQTGSASRTTLFVILVVGAFLAVAIVLLPKGFSDDLSKIGQGVAAVVLTHDKGSTRSLDLMTLLNKVRSDYTGKVEFFVVDVNSRQGQMFIQKQNVAAIALVFFSPNGEKRAMLGHGNDESELRSKLDKLSLEQS